MSLSAGTRPGRYEIRAKIGAGGMGQMYLPQAAARSEGDQNFYESKCATLDRQIDSLVYELYDLTPEEIAIVEGTQK